MSADNFFLVRKHPHGGFVALMGFASDDDEPKVRPDRECQTFDTPIDALLWAQAQPSEYGASVHPECGDLKLSKKNQDGQA